MVQERTLEEILGIVPEVKPRVCLMDKKCANYSNKCPFPHGEHAEECPEFDYIYFKPKQVEGGSTPSEKKSIGNRGKTVSITPPSTPLIDKKKVVKKRETVDVSDGFEGKLESSGGKLGIPHTNTTPTLIGESPKRTHPTPAPTFSPAESGYLFKALTTLISAYRINVKRAKAKGNVSANEADIAICERLVERIREGMGK